MKGEENAWEEGRVEVAEDEGRRGRAWHGITGRFKEGKKEAFQGVATSAPCLKQKKMRE